MTDIQHPFKAMRQPQLGSSYSSIMALTCIGAALLLSGCGSLAPKPKVLPTVLNSKDLVALAPFDLPDSSQTLLESFGWDSARFVEEWRKEMHFQFHRSGIGTTDDTSASGVRVQIRIDRCERDGGPQITGQALLIRPEGRRIIPILPVTKNSGGAERSDPTIDRLRIWSNQVVEGSLRDPNMKKIQKQKTEYVPQMFILF